MSSGLRLVAACTVILFLVVAGLLGGLQDLNQSMRKDPVFASELHAVSFPVPGIAGAQPYQAMDLRQRFGWASVYLKSSGNPSDGVIMIISRLPSENVRLDGDFDKAMNREWKAGSFQPLGSVREVNVQFRGQQHFAQLQVFRNDTQALRHQFLVGLPWGGQTVYVQANGPAELLTQASLQEALDGVEGEAQELVPPETEPASDPMPSETSESEDV
jgi:hypothetical protein